MIPMDSGLHEESRMLAGLPAHEPERQCTDRVRARCHAVLLARRRRTELAPVPPELRPWRLVFEPAVVIVCTGYLAEVVRRALALYGF